MPTTEASVVELSGDETATGPEKPVASLNHSAVQLRLAMAFAASADFLVLPELSLELPDGQRVTPDVAVFPKMPLNWLHDTIRVKVMPTIAVEIPSPTQGFQEIADKIALYFSYGVKTVWVVHSAMQAVAIYLPGENRPQVFTTGEARDPATGLTARLEEIFEP